MANKKTILATLITIVYLFSILSLSSALTISSVSTNPDKISPGETTNVIIYLKNNAEEDITDVSASLDLTNLALAPSESGSQYGFDTIESGKTKQAQFTLQAFSNAASGTYKIPVTVSYKDINNQLTTTQSVISIIVNSEPIIDAKIQDGLFLKGQTSQITVTVVNKGLANVKFLEVNAGTSPYYTLLSQNNIYIGDVDSNDFQTTEFKILFKDNAPSTVTIPINLIYKDITNKEYSQNKDLSLKVYTNQEAINLGLIAKSYTVYYFFVIIALILIYVLYRMLRKKKVED